MHPVLDEFCRIGSLNHFQPMAFRKLQRQMRETVQPLLDEREKLIEENARLSEELAALKKPRTRAKAEPATVTA